MLKQEFVEEEYELYLDAVKPITRAIQKVYGSRAVPGYVLVTKDKEPKQRMNARLFPVTDSREIARYDAMRVLPDDIQVAGSNMYVKRVSDGVWGKHTNKSVLKVMELKELTDLNAMGTGKYTKVVDIDLKNINSNTPSLEAIESMLPKTLITRTPSGGKHYHFIIPKDMDRPRSSTLPCIDFLGMGKLVVLPGQEREGKGHYSYDTTNPNFSWDMAEWNEDIRATLASLFSYDAPSSSDPRTLPGYLDTSSKAQGKAHKHKAMEASDKLILNTVKQVLKDSTKMIEEGMRNRAMFDYCALIADRTPSHELLSRALKFNTDKLVKPLPVKEIEGIVKSCLKSFSCYTGQSKVKADTSKFDNLHAELQNILGTIGKDAEFTMKLEDIAPVVQSFFEVKFGRTYSVAIPTSEVGKILRTAGFEKKKIQVKGARAWLWNFNAEALQQLEATVEALGVVHPVAPSVQNTPSIAPRCPAEEASLSDEPTPMVPVQIDCKPTWSEVIAITSLWAVPSSLAPAPRHYPQASQVFPQACLCGS